MAAGQVWPNLACPGLLRNRNLNSMSSPKNSKTKTDGYYFWNYDLYPFLLGGPGKKEPRGSVVTTNFAPGFHFRPCYEFSLEEGQKFHQRLRELEAEYNAAFETLDAIYKKKREDLLAEAWVTSRKVIPIPKC